MKRILVLSLVFILALSFLVIPGYAVESGVHSTIDLLQAVTYDLYTNDVFVKTAYSTGDNAWVNEVTSASWRWTFPHTSRLDSMVVTIATRKQPSSFTYYDSFGNSRIGTLVGQRSSNGVTYFQYSFGLSGNDSYFIFKAIWDSAYSGDFCIISAFAFLADTVELGTVTYFANAMMFDNGDGGISEPTDTDFRWPVSVGNGSNVSLPVVVDFAGPTGSDFYTIDYGEVFLKVPFDSTFKYFDSVTFLLYTCGELSSLGARLENVDGSVIDGLSFEIDYCGETQMIFELEEQFARIHCYVVTVDVKGYDLTDSYVTLQVNIPSVFGSWIYQYDRGFYFQCSSIVAKYNIEDIPWYAHFGLWLGQRLSSLSDTISYGFNSLLTYFDTVFFNALVKQYESIKTTVSAGFNRVIELLEGKDAQDMQQDVQDQIDDFDHMDDVINSVTTPNVDNIDTDISNIVSSDQLSAVSSVYGSIFGITFISNFVSLVAVLGLASFLIYGKRG